MCCLFGMLDPEHRFTGKQRAKILRGLAAVSEARGTDATGIAYNSGGKLHVFKRPLPAHKVRFHIPEDALVVMGHTRMTTQGDARRNYNNHPFQARAGSQSFALAHNGVLYNDGLLRTTQKLPLTNIETDSFVAVQMLQQQGALTFDSLRYMAEQVEGSFSFTVLDDRDNLYFVKGDNPLCIYHYPETGVYLYASTEEILTSALLRIPFHLGKAVTVKVLCGELLKIDAKGHQSRSEFDTINLVQRWYYPRSFWYDPAPRPYNSEKSDANKEYLRELKAVAAFYGFSPSYVDSLLSDGFTTDDVEEMLYAGEL
ncbi:class II glutamine amidotransferase [Pseudoflavonifractor phocaeensis]|uniref:class II glutamine amidotransferase n=1 Tax=Pseudoflavonifractor phocaeensis TaxID=1870988 RepID=UPI001F2C3D8D|nr:class II glutamine amidotransferase [Pseudoflavonifractor phocaeensis]MCF2596238.1 class II glutamine amidotransferase [Pseudoflavonifractor phocaeensis]